MEEVLRRVIEFWRRQNIELSPPASREHLAAVWRELGRETSTDVVALYSAVAGFADREYDDRCWSFWTLEQLVMRNREFRSTGVLFADFGIDAWGYSFRYQDSERSSVWYNPLFDDDSEQLAASVEEFLRLYLEDPKAVMLG